MKLFAARDEDAHQGWVWLKNPALSSRCIIKIENPANGKCVYCEALQIENNFLEQYKQPPRYPITDPETSLVIGAWYRAGLGGIETQSEVPLVITPCRTWWGKFLACTGHPQVVVRLASWLGGIGLLLGDLVQKKWTQS